MRLPSCVASDRQLVDRLLGRAALLDLDQDVRLVPRLDLDGAVEGRELELRRPCDA